MIGRTELANLTPAKRAQVIFAEAQSQLSNRLWRAALGDGDRSNERDTSPLSGGKLDLEALMGLIADQPAGVQPGCACQCACSCHTQAQPTGFTYKPDPEARELQRTPIDTVTELTRGKTEVPLTLGINARHASALAAAEARTGIPANALAAIVDAEAAKGRDGSWNPLSRNPRSSAAGLGQFLSGTWQDLAQTPGTWLNGYAAERGWLDGHGRVQAGCRSELLSLRYDPQASILCVADYAKRNLDNLEKGGVRVRTDSETLAKAAYLSHHLGLGDARKFLSGGIEAGRARMLLSAQIGASAAEQRIASTGSATDAHRQWLLGFIERRIQPERFGS